jgi:beta-galactosidase
VLFRSVINSGDADVVARVSIGVAAGRAVDVIDDAVFEARRGAFEVRMKPRTVRMLAL